MFTAIPPDGAAASTRAEQAITDEKPRAAETGLKTKGK
jgi:hypothetical protein